MQIFVKTISSRTITLEVDLGETFYDVKEKIKAKDGVPTEKMRLIYSGRQMDDDATLRKHHVEKHATITCCIRAPTHRLYEHGGGTRDNEFQVAQKIREIRTAANLLWRPKLLPEAITRCQAIVVKITESANAGAQGAAGGGCGPACMSELLNFVDHLNQKIDRADSASLSASADLGIPLLCGAIIKMPVSSKNADPARVDSERSPFSRDARCPKEQKVVLAFMCLKLLVSLRRTVQAGDADAAGAGRDGGPTRGLGYCYGLGCYGLAPTVAVEFVRVLQSKSAEEVALSAEHLCELVAAFLGDATSAAKREKSDTTETDASKLKALEEQQVNLNIVDALLEHHRKRYNLSRGKRMGESPRPVFVQVPV